VTDLNAALMEKLLNVPVTQRKAVIEPDGLLDDGHRETVAVGLGVGHGGATSPDPIKATQPSEVQTATFPTPPLADQIARTFISPPKSRT